jgi:hypothetical protein
MNYEEHQKHAEAVERTREYWCAALTEIKAKTRAFLWKWSVIIILGVMLLLILVWKGYIIVVWTGGGGGGP